MDTKTGIFIGEPFDDRVERSEEAPSIREIAKALDTTTLTVRKILVATGYYSTKLSRKVQELYEQGCICTSGT